MILPTQNEKIDLTQEKESMISSKFKFKKNKIHKLKECKSLIIKESIPNKTTRGREAIMLIQVNPNFHSLSAKYHKIQTQNCY